MKNDFSKVLDELRGEYDTLTEQLAGIDAAIDDMRARREVVALRQNVVNSAAIRLRAELEGN